MTLSLKQTTTKLLREKTARRIKTLSGKFPDAQQCFISIRNSHSPMLIAVAYHNRATATKAAEDLQLAITDFTKAIELKPDHADQYILRGIAYTDSGNKDAAIADFRAALLRHPDEKTRQYAEQSLKELGAAP